MVTALVNHDEITKNNFYEESLRVLFIIYCKGHIEQEIDNKSLISYPDIYSTLIDMMDLKSKIQQV